MTGTPRLAIAVGTPTTTHIDYTGGDSTNTLTFTYLVGSGEHAADLDYLSTTALTFHGSGTIKDAAGNAADLTLFSPGSTGSLGSNKDIVVDGVAPTLVQVTPVTTPTNDGTPDYTFHSDEAGTVSYGGDCSSAATAALVGDNTVTFNTLSAGSHNNCTVTVTDALGNASTPLAVTGFTVLSSGGSSASSASRTVSLTLAFPNGGETLTDGHPTTIFWTSNRVATVRLSLSLDGGGTFPVVLDSVPASRGYYSWDVSVPGPTTTAVIKLEGLDSNGETLVTDTSDAPFDIQAAVGGEEVNPPPAVVLPPSIFGETAGLTIDTNNALVTSTAALGCQVGTLIKIATSETVYYCGQDGARHPFFNPRVFASWYPDFSDIIVITPETMQSIPLGADVYYKPGARLVKVTSNPNAVISNAVLRWVTTEDLAAQLYGANWSALVDDIPEAIFSYYQLGRPIMPGELP